MAKQQGFFASCQVEGSLGIGDVIHDLANWQTPMAKPKITRQYGEEKDKDPAGDIPTFLT